MTNDQSEEPAYLGDGLYVTHDGYQVELFAHNGISKTNQVFLDPRTLTNFVKWLRDSGYREALKGNSEN